MTTTKHAVRTYTERLEKVIQDGIELRESMRSKLDFQQQIIATQARDLEAAITAKELFRERRKRLSLKLCATNGEVTKYKSKCEKLIQEQLRQQRFTDIVRRMLKEQGMHDIFSKAGEEMKREADNLPTK
ncbi:hypothetical protein [Atlantibacter hermannii]|uniref:hypothetical protein n=1 Tax=Atlantibacter hermannii TaxID=565 RepID=UPI0034D4C7F3